MNGSLCTDGRLWAGVGKGPVLHIGLVADCPVGGERRESWGQVKTASNNKKKIKLKQMCGTKMNDLVD
jgi:hypothetical protein